jgi:hypothetical protein
MSCSDLGIGEMLKASRVVMLPKRSRYGDQGEATGIFEMGCDFILEEGQESCQEIVKVFITA